MAKGKIGRGKLVEHAVLFTDVCDSTTIFEQLGDAKAHEMVTGLLNDIARAVTGRDGNVIKFVGDGVHAVFNNCDDALQSSLLYLEDAARVGLELRTGIHFGRVIADGGDVYGDPVNVAARLASTAKPNEILISGETLKALNVGLRRDFRQLNLPHLKGKKNFVEIYQMSFEQDSRQTQMVTNTVTPGKLPSIELQYGRKRSLIGPETRKILFGRDSRAHVMVAGDLVSREHATLMLKGNDWTVVDHSTNGTHVVFDSAHSTMLRRQECQLRWDGRLGLGVHPDKDPQSVVKFRIVP